MRKTFKPKKKERSIFGKKIFSREEENSLLLFTAGLAFGIALVDFAIGAYKVGDIILITIFLLLLYIDRRIQK